jgi:hypothetical protein
MVVHKIEWRRGANEKAPHCFDERGPLDRELLPERRAALERWAKHIKGLTADKPAENVVDLALNRRRSK